MTSMTYERVQSHNTAGLAPNYRFLHATIVPIYGTYNKASKGALISSTTRTVLPRSQPPPYPQPVTA